MELVLIAVIVVALLFDFTNGFHDAANAIATSVTTKALSPKVAVAMAAILNFAGAFVSLKVASAIAKDIVDPTAITLDVILAGLVGAIAWNITTWLLGLPTSSSHALIGGVLGSAIGAAGTGVIMWEGLREKVLIPSVAAPLLAIPVAMILGFILLRTFARKSGGRTDGVFRKLQVVSSAFVAFTHGTNDAQKTMGIIWLALIAGNEATPSHLPTWVIVAAGLAIAAGTYAGGWRIIRTLGSRVTDLTPTQGFAAESTTAGILWFTGTVGFPVSTTHTISSSVLGSGIAKSPRSVRWGLAGNIAGAWLLTLPCAALVGATMQALTQLPGGTLLVLACVSAIAAFAFTRRDRSGGAEQHVGAVDTDLLDGVAPA